MIRKKRVWLSVKYFLYALIMLVLYALQTTPGFLAIFGVRPVWLVPFAVAVSMNEGVACSAIFGSLCGLLCDLGSQALFGFNGLILLCGCVTISLLCFFSIKVNWKSAFLLGGF